MTGPARWYVRGPNDYHKYDRKVPLLPGFEGQAFCQTCLVVHRAPIGADWHVEGPAVDRMLCGVSISMDDCEVRSTEPKRLCAACARELAAITASAAATAKAVEEFIESVI